MNTDTHSTLGIVAPCPISKALGTGYSRFKSPTGISGLAKDNDGVLSILAVHAETDGCGQFRNFIAQAKIEYKTIKIYEVWNPMLEQILERYGFRAFSERVINQGITEPVTGFRWDK